MSNRVGFRSFRLSEELSGALWQVLRERWQLEPDDERSAKILASAIHKMSDYYLDHPTDKTPWGEDWCQQAQLAYYLPLNFIRCQAVINEGSRQNFFAKISTAVDFGAGLGAGLFSLAKHQAQIRLTAIESSEAASEIRSRLAQSLTANIDTGHKAPFDLAICSYVLTENVEATDAPSLMTQREDDARAPRTPGGSRHLQKILGSNYLMLIEPSTKVDSRRLLQLRKKLIAEGYTIWAPCTHQGSCPLLDVRENDWCHDRIHFEQPSWFTRIEKHLPFKNENLSMSYLLAAKSKPETRLALNPNSTTAWARITGDYRDEKGKARIMFCRNEKREFLTMLTRHGVLDEISRGALIRVPEEGTLIGNELRIEKNINWD